MSDLTTVEVIEDLRMLLNSGTTDIGGALDEANDRIPILDLSENSVHYVNPTDFTGGGGGHTGTTGSVFFAGAGGPGSAPTEDNSNFFWDNTAKELHLGGNAPNSRLHIDRDVSTGNILELRRSGSGSTNHVIFAGPAGTTPDFAVWGDGRVAIGASEATTNVQFRLVSTNSTGAMVIDQNGTGTEYGLLIDSEAATGDALDVQSSATTANGCEVTADSLTTGRGLYVNSVSSSASTRNLVEVRAGHSSATGCTPLMIFQAAAGWFARLLNVSSTVVFGWRTTGYQVHGILPSTDTAPNDDATAKKWSLQYLSAGPPSNAHFLRFQDAGGNTDHYLVLEEET